MNKSFSTKNNMLSAAIAGGIAITFGSPLAGVLFSIESTASIYIVSNIWKSFFVSVIIIFISNVFVPYYKFQYFSNIKGTQPLPISAEFILIILLGFFGGLIGSFFSTLVAKVVYVRRKSKYSFLNNRFRYALIIGIITSSITFFFPLLRKNENGLMKILWSQDYEILNKFIHPYNSYLLFLYFFLKFLISVLCITMNIPAGVISPLLVIGAFTGRLYGHLLKFIFPISEEYIYAMIGSACVFSGGTHSVSSALLIFEMTGNTTYLVPLLLANIVANLTAQAISMNIFDVLLLIKNLPHLPSIKSPALYNLTAIDISKKIKIYGEYENLKIIDCFDIFFKTPKKKNYSIPIVDKNGTIKYTINVKNLFKYTHDYFERIKLSYNIKNQSNFIEYFSYTNNKFFGVKRSFLEHIKHKFNKLYISLRDKEKIKLQKKFEEDSNMRLITIFKESMYFFN
jgi:chloride channel 2